MVKSLATGNSAFSTFFQMAPRLVSVIRRMRPTWHLGALADVDAAFVSANGIRGLVWDVDGTLTGDRRPAVDQGANAAFRALLAMPGLKHVVLSNAGEARYVELGTMFPELPILRAYTRGDQVLYRRRRGTDDTWTADDVERQIAAGARVIRKPSRVLVDYALRELGVPGGSVVMIGDQYFTDVAGANMAQVRSIKLPTLARETFRTSVRLSQRLELAIYALLYGRAEPDARPELAGPAGTAR
jgi:predicted HAD superfamily phosphohydrolase YqeG